MRFKRALLALLGAACLGCLLMTAGCNGTAQSNSGAGTLDAAPRADWGMSLLAGGTVGVGQFPAKFTFDVTATPDCVNDFVVYNTGLAGASGSKANIVAFNKLYSTQGSVGGLCNQNGPSVYWSYFTGTGSALTSVALSEDGTKVAFVENAAGGATLRVLKWKALQGSGAGAPASVDQVISSSWTTCTVGNSCIASIAFNGGAQDTISAPFCDYYADIIYVGDNNGNVHKFTGVFNGTLAEATTGWPITVNAGTTLTSPVYDAVSGNIYVGDSTGRLSFIREVGSAVGACVSGSPPCLSATHLSVGANGDGAIVDGPIVDGTNGMVFAVNGTESNFNGTILQAPTSLAGSVSFNIGGNHAGGSALYGGAFDSTYLASSKPNVAGHMYVCGKDQSNKDRPAVYQLSFTTATGVLSGVGSTPLTGLSTGNNEACSPITEFNNTRTSTDWIFFSIGDNANSAPPIPSGSACLTDNHGCVISINVTGSPTWPPPSVNNAASVPANSAGAASGIVVDNNSASAQASSIYLSLGHNSTGAGPGVPSCNTTAGLGCAVKLTQSALQ